ncbi:MAG: F-type H+-transporting ATPase subunit b, partial [Actinomycetota bacterium]|nr:F-type H+-transporting ATPase subunit b [Actinomycetota bacterium]
MRKRQLLAGLAIAAGALFASAGVAAAQTTPPTTVKFANEAAKQCVEKLETGGTIDDCQKAPSPIVPAVNEIIWGSIAFVILLGVMWTFALPPVRAMMEAREQKIRGDLEQAEAAKGESERVLEQ